MLDKLDIHNRKRRLELAIQGIRKSELISKKNKEAILSFCDYCFAEGLSVERIEHYARILKKIAELLRIDFEAATKKDIVELIRKIESRKLSAWTKHDYRVALRKFYKWLRNSQNYPEEVVWLKTGNTIKNNMLPEQLLTEKDVEKLIKACSDFQIKALVAVLWETGVRVGELLNIRIKNVEPEDNYARLVVSGKTGMRIAIIFFAWPYLIQWLNVHPQKDDSSSPLWIKRNGKPMVYVDANKRLRNLAKKAKIKKPVNPHAFRHSRATFLAQHLTEAQLSQYFGWVQGSKMTSTYVHLSGRDLLPPMLELYGFEKGGKPKEPELKPLVCRKCKAVNPADAGVCMRCGVFLKLEAAIDAEEKRKKELDAIKRDINILKNMIVAPGSGFRTFDDLERVISGRKDVVEELRKHDLVTNIEELHRKEKGRINSAEKRGN